MKRLFTLLVIAFTLKATHTQAQTVFNSGFEYLNYDGSISNWGNVYILNAGDSIVWDNQSYASTNDAYSGTKAMELSNAWNFTSNTGIAGLAAVDDDTVFSSWSSLNLVSTNSTTFTPFTPANFGFYFKYFPVNNDSACGRITLWDSLGNQLGEGLAVITGTYNSYTQIVAPIVYTAPGDVAFYSMSFTTFFSLAPGSHQPSFGTRLFVDNITFNNTISGGIAGIKTILNNEQIEVYPNPALNQISIKTEIETEMQFYVYNVFGQVLLQGLIDPAQPTISLEKIASGFYTIEVRSEHKIGRHSFVVSR